jgi:hypothetical protein
MKYFRLLLSLFLCIAISCGRIQHVLNDKPIAHQEITKGGFLYLSPFANDNSWAYIEFLPDTTLYQIVYDCHKDSVFITHGHFQYYMERIFPSNFYAVKYDHEKNSIRFRKRNKIGDFNMVLFRGLWYEYILEFDPNYEGRYNYVRRKPYRVLQKELLIKNETSNNREIFPI